MKYTPKSGKGNLRCGSVMVPAGESIPKDIAQSEKFKDTLKALKEKGEIDGKWPINPVPVPAKPAPVSDSVVAKRESAVKEREDAVEAQIATFTDRETAVKEREDAVEARETAVLERESSAQERENILNELANTAEPGST